MNRVTFAWFFLWYCTNPLVRLNAYAASHFIDT